MKNAFARAVVAVTALASASAMAQTTARPAAAATPAFDVLEFVVEGNTLLAPELVEKVLSPYMGPGKTFKDIEAARNALEKSFQEAGYLSVLVNLPNQKVSDGEVRIEVNEASVAQLKVTGAQYHLPSRIREAVPSLAEGSVPLFPQVQKELGDVQTRDLQITPIVGSSEDGAAVEVELKVQDEAPLHGSVEINNVQNFNTSQGRVSAGLNYSNLFQRGHSLGFFWQYAPDRPTDGNSLSTIYSLPLNPRDTLLGAFTISDSETPSNVGTSSGPTATITKGQIYSLLWMRQLNSRGWPVQHDMFLGLDYRNNKDANRYAQGFTTAKPPLRYPLLSAGYNLNKKGSSNSVFSLNTSVKVSSDGLAGRMVNCDGVERDQFECRRKGGSADFMALRLGMAYEQSLGKWRLKSELERQVASAPLPSADQYSLGGIETVRGYYDDEQSGDEGWRARLELHTPTWLTLGDAQFTALAFLDRGDVHFMDAQATQLSYMHLGSSGLGLRVDGDKGLSVRLDAARPIFSTQKVVDGGQRAYASGPKAGRSVRWHFSLRQSF